MPAFPSSPRTSPAAGPVASGRTSASRPTSEIPWRSGRARSSVRSKHFGKSNEPGFTGWSSDAADTCRATGTYRRLRMRGIPGRPSLVPSPGFPPSRSRITPPGPGTSLPETSPVGGCEAERPAAPREPPCPSGTHRRRSPRNTPRSGVCAEPVASSFTIHISASAARSSCPSARPSLRSGGPMGTDTRLSSPSITCRRGTCPRTSRRSTRNRRATLRATPRRFT